MVELVDPERDEFSELVTPLKLCRQARSRLRLTERGDSAGRQDQQHDAASDRSRESRASYASNSGKSLSGSFASSLRRFAHLSAIPPNLSMAIDHRIIVQGSFMRVLSKSSKVASESNRRSSAQTSLFIGSHRL